MIQKIENFGIGEIWSRGVHETWGGCAMLAGAGEEDKFINKCFGASLERSCFGRL